MNQYISIAAQLTKPLQDFYNNITTYIQNQNIKLISLFKDFEQQMYILKLT